MKIFIYIDSLGAGKGGAEFIASSLANEMCTRGFDVFVGWKGPEDSKYFFDGWGIPDEEGDYLFLEDTGKVKIVSIDYNNNKITLKNNHSWNVGKAVFYCPKGKCFSGKAPDIGAHEYFDEKEKNQISAPTLLRVKPPSH